MKGIFLAQVRVFRVCPAVTYSVITMDHGLMICWDAITCPSLCTGAKAVVLELLEGRKEWEQESHSTAIDACPTAITVVRPHTPTKELSPCIARLLCIIHYIY